MLHKKIAKNSRQIWRRWTWISCRRKRILRTRIEDLLKDGVKLYIGCGDKKLKDYVNIDIVPTEGTDAALDVSEDLHLVPSDIASEVRLEAVFEHFYRYSQDKILKDFHRILKKGGRLIIKWLPDFDAIIDAYIKQEKGISSERFDLFEVYRLTHGDPTLKNSPYQLHKDIFTKATIKELLGRNGFQIEDINNEVFPGEELALNLNIIAVKA